MRILGAFLVGLLLFVPASDGPPEQVVSAARAFAQAQTQQQNARFQRDGQYEQVLPQKAELAAEGVVLVPQARTQGGRGVDVQQRATSDAEPFISPLTTPAPGEVEFRVDVYESPQGWGYVVVAEWTDEQGTRWAMSENHGPLTWVGHSWQPVGEEQ
jgi:hypothetical protein